MPSACAAYDLPRYSTLAMAASSRSSPRAASTPGPPLAAPLAAQPACLPTRDRQRGYQLGTAPSNSFCSAVPCSRSRVTRGPSNGSRDFIQAFW